MALVVSKSPAPAAADVAGVAGSEESKGTSPLAIGIGYVLVVAGAFVGWQLWKHVKPGELTPGPNFTIFAPLYILAQGIERFLDPLVSWASEGKTKTAEKERNAAFATLANTPSSTNAGTAASKQADVNRLRRNVTVITWGVASALAMAACGAWGIRLLHTAGFDIPPFWDIALTGLAIGSGTKPLHDLISNIQKAKDQKADPNAVETIS
jgi:hypothetical protein